MPRHGPKSPGLLDRYRPRWLTRNEALLAIVVVLLSTKLIQVLSLNNWPSFKKRADPCIQPTGLHDRLYLLTEKVTRALDRLGVVHWLQYGSLLGALRYRAILPWDDDVDLAILGSSMGSLTLDDLQRELLSEQVSVTYSLWGGFFVFQLEDGTDGDEQRPSARLDAMIYEKEGSYWMNRVGIERFVFWLNYRHWHRFPQHLVFPLPLEHKKFGPISVPVPHHGNKMLPYLFAQNWWTEKRPQACSIDSTTLFKEPF